MLAPEERTRDPSPIRWASIALLLAALGALAALTAMVRAPSGPLSIDRTVLRVTVDHRTNALVSASRVVIHLGDPVILVVEALVITALLWIRFRTVLPTVLPLGALLVAEVVGAAGKKLIDRSRPPAVYHLVREADASFPSGHATGSAALFLALALVLSPTLRHRATRVAVIVGALLITGFIGAARILLGVHWATDVAAGWLLGVAAAVAAGLAADALMRLPVMRGAGGDRSTRFRCPPPERLDPSSAAGIGPDDH